MEVKRVFISYSNVDREIAEKIADILKNEGVEYFFGEKNIQWGNDIKNIINDTLANRITHEIVILSPASIKSQWVAYEIGFATAKDVIILPFLTHPSVEIPLFMKGYNYKVDLNDVRNYFRNEEKYMTIYNENGEKEEVYSFATLLRLLNSIEGIERIRFISPHPKDFTTDVIEAIRDCKKVCKLIHLPLQSGSTEVLKAMNRKYTKENFLSLVEKIQKEIPDIEFSTDIIVGFPGETEEDFTNTLDVVSKVKFEQIYMFIYSRRVGTVADKMENQIPEEIKHSRFNRLKELAEKIIAEKNTEYVGKVIDILVEGKSKTNDNMYTGRTETNKVVNFEGTDENIGKIVKVKIVSEHMWYLKGKII